MDPYCSIIVEELGMTSCDSNPSTEALLTNQKPSFGESVIELVSVIGAGVLLVLVIVLVIILVLCCVCRRKSKSTKSNDIRYNKYSLVPRNYHIHVSTPFVACACIIISLLIRAALWNFIILGSTYFMDICHE